MLEEIFYMRVIKWQVNEYQMIIVEANHSIGAHQPILKKTSRSFKLYKQ